MPMATATFGVAADLGRVGCEKLSRPVQVWKASSRAARLPRLLLQRRSPHRSQRRLELSAPRRAARRALLRRRRRGSQPRSAPAVGRVPRSRTLQTRLRSPMQAGRSTPNPAESPLRELAGSRHCSDLRQGGGDSGDIRFAHLFTLPSFLVGAFTNARKDDGEGEGQDKFAA